MTDPSPLLRLGTRGSPLALAQAREVKERLAAAHPELAASDKIEIVVIKTTGDRIQDRALMEIGGPGLFTTEIEEALLDGRIDVAVHSMKDVPTWLPEGLAITSILEREDPRDAWFSRAGQGLADLPSGAVVGTASLRRQAQVLYARRDLSVATLRGNVETRLAKLERGDVDATLLALSGLKRLGRSVDRSVQTLWRALDPERDALVVVSDHGHLPIFEMVRPNRALAEHGLVKMTSEGGTTRFAADTPMVAVTSGASFHIYLNLQGREPEGVVPRTEIQHYLNRAARVLSDLSVEGRPVVDRIFTPDQAAEIGLNSPNTGDLVVFLTPGFATSHELDGPVTEASRFFGQHGYLASHDGM